MNESLIETFVKDDRIQNLVDECYFHVSYHDIDVRYASEDKYCLKRDLVDCKDTHFLTLVLLRAALAGRADVVESCLQGGGDVYFTDAGGRTALHHGVLSQSVAVVELLFLWEKKKQDSDKKSCMLDWVNERDLRGWTPLHLAVCREATKICSILLCHGADLNVLLHHNCSPCRETPTHSKVIHFAAIKCHLEIFEMLLHHGANASEKDACGFVPLHFAASRGDLDFTQALLRYAPETVNALDDYQRTPLHVAAVRGQTAIVQMLLDNGSWINLKDKWDMTPYHLAMATGNKATAKVLLDGAVNGQVVKDSLRPITAVEMRRSGVSLTYEETRTVNTLRRVLEEREIELLRRCVAQCGATVCLNVLNETLDIGRKGGMTIQGGSRQKTPGGIFLKLLREHLVKSTGSHEAWSYITAMTRERQRARRGQRRREPGGQEHISSDTLGSSSIKS